MVGTLRIRSSDGLRLSRPALLDEVARILRFGLAGLANTAISIGVILLLERLCGLDPFVANAGGFAVGIIVSFVLHRRFVFRAHRVGAPVLRYAVMVMSAFLANQLVLAAGLATLPTFAGKTVVAQAVALATYTAVSFLLCRLWVFCLPPPSVVLT